MIIQTDVSSTLRLLIVVTLLSFHRVQIVEPVFGRPLSVQSSQGRDRVARPGYLPLHTNYY